MNLISEDISNINFEFLDILAESFPTAIQGIVEIRKVLENCGINLPMLFELDLEGDEFVLEIDSSGNLLESSINPPGQDNHFLYVVYIKENDGSYIFHSEITSLDGIETILRESEEDNIEDV